jgi:hypothetical protein
MACRLRPATAISQHRAAWAAGSPPLARTALKLPARPGRRVPELHGERAAPRRLRRRPRILIDYQPVDRHRALGQPDDPDVKPMPGRHLQAHAVEQPAEIRDGGAPASTIRRVSSPPTSELTRVPVQPQLRQPRRHRKGDLPTSDSLPGTSAEILDDLIRKIILPDNNTVASGSTSCSHPQPRRSDDDRRSCSRTSGGPTLGGAISSLADWGLSRRRSGAAPRGRLGASSPEPKPTRRVLKPCQTRRSELLALAFPG